jgi:hypothetical protein
LNDWHGRGVVIGAFNHRRWSWLFFRLRLVFRLLYDWRLGLLFTLRAWRLGRFFSL